MKNLRDFVSEATYDPDIAGRSQIRTMGQGGRLAPSKKKDEAQKTRMKAAGGGKMVPAKDYKPRSDIGTPKPKSANVQQPTKERGSEVKQSYADKVRGSREKPAQARIAKKSGGEVKKDTTSAKSSEKQATELLKKKTTKAVNPNYKLAKASGMTRQERMKVTRKGETELRAS